MKNGYCYYVAHDGTKFAAREEFEAYEGIKPYKVEVILEVHRTFVIDARNPEDAYDIIHYNHLEDDPSIIKVKTYSVKEITEEA